MTGLKLSLVLICGLSIFGMGCENRVDFRKGDSRTDGEAIDGDSGSNPGGSFGLDPLDPRNGGTPGASPGNGGTPGTPSDGGTPGTPSDGGTPGTPSDGGTPGTPSDGGTPGTPSDGGTPGTPSDGGTPGTPSDGGTPGTPSDGGTPGTPSDGGTPGTPGGGSGTTPPPGENFSNPSPTTGTFEFVSAVNRNNVWVVTNYMDGMNVYLITLDAAKNYPMKQWRVEDTAGTGNRTFVSKAGLFIGKQGGALFRVEENHPANRKFSPVWVAPGAESTTRNCLTSYTIDGTSFVGVAWESSNGVRKFTRIPIDLNLPEKIDVARARTVSIGSDAVHGNSRWSYGCFTDQVRLQFWGGWKTETSFFGIDLKTLQPLNPATHAPNRGHSNAQLGERFIDPAEGRDGSYAIAGDSRGNVLTGTGMYTFAHDSRNDVVYGSQKSVSQLIVAKGDCFHTEPSCAGKVIEVGLSDIGRIGPLSSMNDGRVIGIVRGPETSQVYILNLKNSADLKQSIEATRIKEVTGNAYMYSDFTGGTLSAQTIDLAVELDKITGFNSAKAVKTLSFSWTAQAGGSANWKGLSMQARCYKAGVNPPAFQAVTNIQPAGAVTPIAVSSCLNAVADRLEIQVRPADLGAGFTRTSQIRVFGTQ